MKDLQTKAKTPTLWIHQGASHHSKMEENERLVIRVEKQKIDIDSIQPKANNYDLIMNSPGLLYKLLKQRGVLPTLELERKAEKQLSQQIDSREV